MTRRALDKPLSRSERQVCADGDIDRLVLAVFETAVSDLDEGLHGYQPYSGRVACGTAKEQQARASSYVFFFDMRHGSTGYSRLLKMFGLSTNAYPVHAIFHDPRAAYRRRRDIRLLGLRHDLIDRHVLFLIRNRSRRAYHNVTRMTVRDKL